jgi:hypothetical protein
MLIEPAKIEMALNGVPAVQTLLGPVVAARLTAPEPACYLFRALQGNENTLGWWQLRCATYLASVTSVPDAVAKLSEDLLGHARKDPPDAFDERLADAMTEISAVCELSSRGCSAFVPIMPTKAGRGRTHSAVDYQCIVTDDAFGEAARTERAYVEVKNLRAPLGITDVFARAFAKTAAAFVALNGCGIVLDHSWDNTVTAAQRAVIEEFVESLPDRAVPSATTIILPGNVNIKVRLVPGANGVSLVRGIGGDHPIGPFTDTTAFIRKATETIRKGIAQLSVCGEGLRLLVLNIQSPDAMFAHEIGIELQKIVTAVSRGSAHSILLHHHSFIEV